VLLDRRTPGQRLCKVWLVMFQRLTEVVELWAPLAPFAQVGWLVHAGHLVQVEWPVQGQTGCLVQIGRLVQVQMRMGRNGPLRDRAPRRTTGCSKCWMHSRSRSHGRSLCWKKLCFVAVLLHVARMSRGLVSATWCVDVVCQAATV